MTDAPVYTWPDPAMTAALRGALPDAPLPMPTQSFDAGDARWTDRIMTPLRLLRLPMSRGV